MYTWLYQVRLHYMPIIYNSRKWIIFACFHRTQYRHNNVFFENAFFCPCLRTAQSSIYSSRPVVRPYSPRNANEDIHVIETSANTACRRVSEKAHSRRTQLDSTLSQLCFTTVDTCLKCSLSFAFTLNPLILDLVKRFQVHWTWIQVKIVTTSAISIITCSI